MLSISMIAGRIAGIVTFIAFIPYVIATLRKQIRPNRATWIIWTLVGFTFVVAYRDLGATDSLWVAIGNLCAFFFVMALAIPYGEGGWTRLDRVCLISAVVGFGIWWLMESPLLAMLVSIGVDFLGAIPTLIKTYKNPKSENKTAWVLFLVANTINLFSLSEWSFALAAFPVYFFAISLTQVLLFKRKDPI